MNRPRAVFAAASLALLAGVTPSQAVISYTTSGGTIMEEFDTLATTGTANAWTNDSTLAGWSLFRQPAPGTAIPTYSTGTGSSNTGAIYSFGGSGSGERALGGVASGGAYWGSPPSGTLAGWMAVAVSNDTGSTLDSFSVLYDGEQWRDGGATDPQFRLPQTMVLEYGFGATFATVSTWITPGSAFNFTSPIFVAAAGTALDGNAPANRLADRGGTVGSLTWSPGDTLWIRWIENNDAGNDHGLAIDHWRFSATPEPATLAMLALGALVGVRRRR